MNHNNPVSMFRTTAFASALLFAGVSLAAADPATVTLGRRDSRRSVEVKVGDTVAIRLSARMGTGHRWFLAPIVDPALTQDGEPKVEPVGQAKQLPGGSEFQVFRFTAKAAGKTDLKFQYFREFESGKKPLRSATFHIKVVASGK